MGRSRRGPRDMLIPCGSHYAANGNRRGVWPPILTRSPPVFALQIMVHLGCVCVVLVWIGVLGFYVLCVGTSVKRARIRSHSIKYLTRAAPIHASLHVDNPAGALH